MKVKFISLKTMQPYQQIVESGTCLKSSCDADRFNDHRVEEKTVRLDQEDGIVRIIKLADNVGMVGCC
jgi:hypothetical protein